MSQFVLVFRCVFFCVYCLDASLLVVTCRLPGQTCLWNDVWCADCHVNLIHSPRQHIFMS